MTAAGEAVLSDRGRGIQVRWRELVVEPLVSEPPAPAVPPDYREVDCGADLTRLSLTSSISAEASGSFASSVVWRRDPGLPPPVVGRAGAFS
jgi:hypothetical protein